MGVMLEKGEQETAALKADTAVSRATRPPEKAALEADIPTQIEEFLRRGGKIQYLGPQYKGKAFDESMRALVAKGNINAVLERLIATSKPNHLGEIESIFIGFGKLNESCVKAVQGGKVEIIPEKLWELHQKGEFEVWRGKMSMDSDEKINFKHALTK
jgi:hypothetical protein